MESKSSVADRTKYRRPQRQRVTDAAAPDPVTMTVYETAARYRIGLTTVATAIASGDLPSTKIGRRRLIWIDDADRWARGDAGAVVLQGEPQRIDTRPRLQRQASARSGDDAA